MLKEEHKMAHLTHDNTHEVSCYKWAHIMITWCLMTSYNIAFYLSISGLLIQKEHPMAKNKNKTIVR